MSVWLCLVLCLLFCRSPRPTQRHTLILLSDKNTTKQSNTPFNISCRNSLTRSETHTYIPKHINLGSAQRSSVGNYLIWHLLNDICLHVFTAAHTSAHIKYKVHTHTNIHTLITRALKWTLPTPTAVSSDVLDAGKVGKVRQTDGGRTLKLNTWSSSLRLVYDFIAEKDLNGSANQNVFYP